MDGGDCLSALEQSSGADDSWTILITSFAYDEKFVESRLPLEITFMINWLIAVCLSGYACWP